MSTPTRKCSPVWLAKQDPDDPFLNVNYRRSVRYYRKLFQAWPDWCATDPRFVEINKKAARMRKLGRNVHVDHIVPICSPLVCGLHVPWNLQILEAGPNMSKSNHMWPGHPNEPLQMFELQPEPHQLRLPL